MTKACAFEPVSGITRDGSAALPGSWALQVSAGGRYVALVVTCPRCGRSFEVSTRVHAISPSGVLHPSLTCPHGCGYHEMPVQMLGWRHGRDPRTR